MNCKRGDVVIVVSAMHQNAGRIGEVVDVAVDRDAPAWFVAGCFITALSDASPVAWFYDSDLRPIGKPREHERDEMLRPLPVEDLDIAHA